MKLNNQKSIVFLAMLVLTSITNAQVLKDIVLVEQMPANSNKVVSIDLDVADGRDVVRIGDKIAFCFKASKAGYISLWNIGTSGKVSKIYPFKEQDILRKVTAGTRECVGNTRFKVTGPTGTENVVLYWTADQAGQIQATRYDNAKDFSNSLESKAENIVQTGSYSDWATETVVLEVIGSNAPVNEPLNIGGLSQTGGQYDNIYVLAFGSNVGVLKKTNDDAKLFVEMAKASFGVNDANIKLFTNAYRKDFMAGFEWLKDNVGKNDLVLVYYSGHGTQIPDDNGDEADKLDEALVPYDLANEKNLNDPRAYIRDDQLRDWLSSIDAKTVVSLFDACHSGGLHKGFSRGGLLNARPKFFSKGQLAGQGDQYHGGLISKDMSRDIIDAKEMPTNGNTKYVMLAAAGEFEYALEIPRKGGVFTLGLYDILKNTPEVSNWSEMTEVLSRSIKRASNGRQTPTAVDPDNGLKDLILK